ncbi:hypothetical protein VEE34_45130 (plasmid) [Escherichia coli]|nr:hypothetical protein VEE34_45130 [Escherichia coli]
MNTALSIIDDTNSNTAIDYRQEMNVIHEIVAECEKEIAFMYQVHDFVYGDERHNMINRLLQLNLKWFTEFGHLNRGDMLTSEQHRCHNEKKKFQRRV